MPTSVQSTRASETPAADRPSGRLSAIRSVGPGLLVTAAFIGPGTVTTATLAGVRFGYTLLWAIGFSVLATIILQKMASRLGLVTGTGLGEAVRRRFRGRRSRLAAVALIVGAIAVGNAAYETGNLLGAALGLRAIFGGGLRLWALGIAAVAFALLHSGSYRVVERVMIGLVAVMAMVFLVTMAALAPAPGPILEGLFIPRVPDGTGLIVAVGLIGTTVVPYNLFLHAAAVREKWDGPEQLGLARFDLGFAILLGGAVTMAIVITSAAVRGVGGIADAADMAVQLEPLLGGWARAFFAIGLLAAGLTSAITAPLAAAYATAGAVGWPLDLRDRRLKRVWQAVLGAGVLFAMAGVSPVPAILFAQVANGVLLPAVAIFLLLVVNDREAMGRWANGWMLNALGAAVVIIAAALGVWAVVGVF